MEEKQFKLNFFITVFLAAATISAFWFFVFSPLLKDAEKLRRNFELSRELLLAMNQKEDRFAELKKLDLEVENHFSTLAATVLSEKDILDFIVLLEDLARSSGVVLTIDSSPSLSSRKGESFRRLAFRLNVLGSFPNVYKFFHSLEYFDFWANVEEIKIVKLNDFALPAGSKFGELTTNDVSAMINLSVFLGE